MSARRLERAKRQLVPTERRDTMNDRKRPQRGIRGEGRNHWVI